MTPFRLNMLNNVMSYVIIMSFICHCVIIIYVKEFEFKQYLNLLVSKYVLFMQ